MLIKLNSGSPQNYIVELFPLKNLHLQLNLTLEHYYCMC